jgi:RHS repeat-associated protein
VTTASTEKSGLFGGGTDTWTYDAIGNRLTSTVDGEPRTYTYFKNGTNPLNGQRLASDGELAYTYDANGNTLTRSGVTFGWDADDRMTSIAGAVTASYAYDHQGRRTSKTVGGTSTSYLYDGLNLVRTSGTSAAEYLFGPGIDEPLAMLRGGSVYYVSVDGLGSVTLLSDAGGSVETTYLYDAWGELREQSGSLATDFGYTAREFGEAGLWFYRARYYQGGIGRFASEDPIGFEGGMNLFAYVRSDPMGWTDPLGTAPFFGRGCFYYLPRCGEAAGRCGDDKRRKEKDCVFFGDDPDLDGACGQPGHADYSTDAFLKCWMSIPDCQRALETCSIYAIQKRFPGIKIPFDKIPRPKPNPTPAPTPCPGR